MWQIDVLSIVREAISGEQNLGVLIILMLAIIAFLMIYTINKNK